MKTLAALLIAVFFSVTLCAQPTSEHNKLNVENGLTMATTIPAGQAIPTAKILDRMQALKIPGASVAVVNNGQVEWAATYGVANSKSGEALTTTTLFQCASIGKIITAMTILNLVKEGQLDLDTDVNTYLKSWTIKDNEFTQQQKVTLRHLLSHSAGLTDEYGFLGYEPGDAIPTTVQILKNESPSTGKKSLVIKRLPGTEEQYSGGGYVILQLLIEDITGLPYTEQVQKVIFDPLNMSNSTYASQPDQTAGKAVAVGHLSNGKPLKKKPYHIYPEHAAAGPWTTAEDLAQLIIEVQKANKGTSESILNQTLTNEFLTPYINRKGLGVNIRGLEAPAGFWHAGNNLGYTGLFWGLIEAGKGAVILTNSDGGERLIQEFICSVANTYDWPVMQAVSIMDTPTTLSNKIVGEYLHEETQKSLIIGQGDSGIFIQPGDAKRTTPLFRIKENHYTVQDGQDYLKIEFLEEAGSTTGLRYIEGVGKILDMKKMK